MTLRFNVCHMTLLRSKTLEMRRKRLDCVNHELAGLLRMLMIKYE